MTTTTEGTGTGSAEGPLRGFDLDNIRKVYINQSGVLLPCIYIVGSGGAEKYVLRVAGDGQVKIDATDEADYLGAKLVEGTNINFTVSVGPNKTLTIDATDQFVKVDAGDSTASYLATKLLAGTGITLTPSVGPNKTLTIDATGPSSDEKVKVDAIDSTAGYLDGKLVAGTNITLTPSVGPNKTLTIASTAAGGDEKVKIDALDSTAGYLDTKLLAGSGITLTTSVGPNKDMTISASGNPVVVDISPVNPDFNEAVLSITSVIKGTVTANFTMTNLTITDGVTDKMLFRLEFTQTGGGGDISSWNAANFVGSDLVPLTSVGLSIGAGKTDILILEWDAARAKWMLVGFFNGIAP